MPNLHFVSHFSVILSSQMVFGDTPLSNYFKLKSNWPLLMSDEILWVRTEMAAESLGCVPSRSPSDIGGTLGEQEVRSGSCWGSCLSG